MFNYVEIHKVDPRYGWIEVSAQIAGDEAPTVLRQPVSEDPREMAVNYLQRIRAGRDNPTDIPHGQQHALEELFEEACMARVMKKAGGSNTDLLELFPTNIIHFTHSEKSTFRKSRPVRIKMFMDEGYARLRARDFEGAMKRLDQVHLLDPENSTAFELKIICLRSWKKTEKCVRVFEEWIEAHPREAAPRLGLGEMWLHLEQYVRARKTFIEILAGDKADCMALVGLAQARLKLGEDPINDLRKASLVDRDYVVEMVEHHFDFRSRNPEDLAPRSLEDIAGAYRIPLQRIKERAVNGVLPAFSPDQETGLLRFSKTDLDLHYEVLKILGLEIDGKVLAAKAQPEAVQPGLFEEE
ncbi:MAG: hypothetical protein QNK37_26100 [Acidobacteriota bacterium]|nr:hypothetical protein [Acidobacteriota bacterium]